MADEGFEVPGSGWHRCYTGYFVCFNRGDYYEAHDVLEHLWLRTSGDDAEFYKALIQLAGAYVHLRLQAEQPAHPKHSRRLRPAARLFRLAAERLALFVPQRHGLNTQALVALCRACAETIESSGFRRNPWAEGIRPQLVLAD